jgi:GTP-binding protein HflX
MEKAFLIIPKAKLDQLDEALTLAETAGYKITRIWKSRYRNRLGRGLIAEIARASEEEKPSTIIFYGEPQPSSVFTLIKETGINVIDRVQLILKIFVEHAGSKEAKLQIEMARIKHELPLIREFIRRSKMGELPGFLGPGGYAIDAYYRHLTSRLARLRRELEKIKRTRSTRRTARNRAGMLHIAITGYASAGKTTLFNRITGLNKAVGPEYFTTLHTKHSRVKIKGYDMVFVDTVGFIRDIPPTIIEAFHSTLEEIAESDIIIFVVDASKCLKDIAEELSSGFEILSKIGATGIPIIIALNKIDLLEGSITEKLEFVKRLIMDNPFVASTLPISAIRGDNIGALLEEIVKVIESGVALGPLQEGVRAETRP